VSDRRPPVRLPAARAFLTAPRACKNSTPRNFPSDSRCQKTPRPETPHEKETLNRSTPRPLKIKDKKPATPLPPWPDFGELSRVELGRRREGSGEGLFGSEARQGRREWKGKKPVNHGSHRWARMPNADSTEVNNPRGTEQKPRLRKSNFEPKHAKDAKHTAQSLISLPRIDPCHPCDPWSLLLRLLRFHPLLSSASSPSLSVSLCLCGEFFPC
jgi:hypothetical protein